MIPERLAGHFRPLEPIPAGLDPVLSPQGKIEAVLFLATKAIDAKRLAKLIEAKPEEVDTALKNLIERYAREDSGLGIIENEGKYQLVSNPKYAELAKSLVKEEVSGELTRPSLETLTIIAYRGPITKPEIEQIRGINCSVIIRNLLMRGLIEERDDQTRLQPVYTITNDFLRHLGLGSVSELPNFDELSVHESIEEVLDEGRENEDNSEKKSVEV